MEGRGPLPDTLFWMDMVAPTHEEHLVIERTLKVDIPSRTEVWKNNVLNRLYTEKGIAYMTAALISKADSPYPHTSAVTFIVGQNFLLTVHDISPTSFQNFQMRLNNQGETFNSPAHLLTGLIEEIINRIAFNAELVVSSLDEISHGVFGVTVLDKASPDGRIRKSTEYLKTAIKTLGTSADLNSQISESLHSLNRMLLFLRRFGGNDTTTTAIIDILTADTMALNAQSSFLSDKVTFLLDATLGLINVEQNVIIKIFSIVTVFFLPPTLVSSMYGMNFHNMPELEWEWGYPMAVAIMLLCALLSYVYFRRKEWL